MILEEMVFGLVLGIVYGGISSFPILLLSIIFRYFTDEKFPPIMGVIIGLGILGISGGLLAIFDEPTTGKVVQVIVASLIIIWTVNAGDKLASKMPKQRISITKMFDRTKKAKYTMIKIPNEASIRDMVGKPRVTDNLKRELSGKELMFPSDLPIEELTSRIRRRLIIDWSVGDAEVELDEEGKVIYLAIAAHEQGISDTIKNDEVALPLKYETIPFGLAPGDIVKIYLEDNAIIHQAEVRGMDKEAGTITIMLREELLEKYRSKKAIQIVALPILRPVPLVKDIMTTSVQTVTADDDIKSVVQLMNKFRIGSVIVVEGKRPVAILTERDVLQRVIETGLNPQSVKVRNVMSTPVLTIASNATVGAAIQLMKGKKVKKLPVVENGELIGIITANDILRCL